MHMHFGDRCKLQARGGSSVHLGDTGSTKAPFHLAYKAPGEPIIFGSVYWRRE